jgi:drug/metabolite transporter (DMT)-like permease
MPVVTRAAPIETAGSAARLSATAEPSSGGVRSAALTEWLLLLTPGVIWGASFLFIAEGLTVMAPDGVTFVRIAIGFATLSLVPAARRPIDPRDRRGTALLGVLWLAFPLSMFPHAEQHVSSALTGMLNGATPLFVTVVASLRARALPAAGIVRGLLVGLAGAVLMAVPSSGEGESRASGIFLILAALASYGVAFNLARPLQQRSGALPVIWRALGVALLLTAPLGLPAALAAQWTPRAFLALLALGALGTGLANVIAAVAAGRIGTTRASATAFLIPVVALLLGVLVRGEHVAPLAIAGGGVCIAGAWLIRRASQ